MQERRLALRYRYRCPVHVEGPGGARFPAATCNVASTGVELEVTHDLVVALAQGGALLTPGDRVTVWLPAPTVALDPQPRALAGQARHVRRVAQNAYQVGVEFGDLAPEQKQVLEALLARAREETPL